MPSILNFRFIEIIFLPRNTIHSLFSSESIKTFGDLSFALPLNYAAGIKLNLRKTTLNVFF